jgi:hypothetical protein
MPAMWTAVRPWREILSIHGFWHLWGQFIWVIIPAEQGEKRKSFKAIHDDPNC